MTRNYYHYEDEMMRKKTEEHFTADSWSYTEDGYLMFSGTGALDEMYVMTLSDVKEYAALPGGASGRSLPGMERKSAPAGRL